jgi:hypothetical protein
MLVCNFCGPSLYLNCIVLGNSWYFTCGCCILVFEHLRERGYNFGFEALLK